MGRKMIGCWAEKKGEYFDQQEMEEEERAPCALCRGLAASAAARERARLVE